MNTDIRDRSLNRPRRQTRGAGIRPAVLAVGAALFILLALQMLPSGTPPLHAQGSGGNSAPVFGSSKYAFTVSEGASVGSAVGTVSASDADAGDLLAYTIASGNEDGVFSMAVNTGGGITITVSKALDYEAKRRYAFTVQVVDSGGGGTATATVSVEVTNVLDVCSDPTAVAVTSPSTTNTGLAGDCEVLLVAKDTLRGTGSLNWSTGTAIGSWDGVTVSGTPKRVTKLEFRRPSDGALSKMSSAERALVRQPLTGVIPWELGSLGELTVLDLAENSLTGSIPPELGSLSKVTNLNLSRNSLSGSIPPELGSLSKVTNLRLTGNSLTGSIPPALGSLCELRELWLMENQLTGSIPPELGNLRNLWLMNLKRNQLSGEIPRELGNLRNLQYLILYGNRLSGEIPQELGGLTSLRRLALGLPKHEFTGCVPAGLRNILGNDVHAAGLLYCNSAPAFVFGPSEYAFTVGEDASVGSAVGAVSASDGDAGDTLSYSIVSGNEGTVFSMAASTGAITVGGALDYEAKRRYALTVQVSDGNGGTATAAVSVEVTNVLDVCLGGVAVTSPSTNTGLAGDCEVLLVAKDALRGTGSLNWGTGTAIGSWDGVTVSGTPNRVTGLALGSRSLTGSIPWELGSLGELTVLDLSGNSLTGSIPPELGLLSKLTTLSLSWVR